MLGSDIELKWNRKDLESLDIAVRLCGKHRKLAVQAGGCLGVFAKHLSPLFESVITFEPDPELSRKLAANVPERNVIIVQAALGAAPGSRVRTICQLRPDDGKTVLHEGMTRTEKGGLIPVVSIDALKLPYCDLIYLDVEGDELAALKGATKTIALHKPIVACEINRGIVYRGFTRDDVLVWFRVMNYELAGSHRSDVMFAPATRAQ